MDCLNKLCRGPFQSTAVNEDGGARTRPGGTGLMPPWMLRHANE